LPPKSAGLAEAEGEAERSSVARPRARTSATAASLPCVRRFPEVRAEGVPCSRGAWFFVPIVI